MVHTFETAGRQRTLELHPFHMPIQLLFHFFVLENSSDYFLQSGEGCFAFYYMIKGPVVHTVYRHFNFICQ